jgi:ATP-dependent Lhr-like helicase
MRDILVGEETYPYLDAYPKQLLESKRKDQQALLADEFAPIEHDDNGFIRWTWAGGNINNTLRAIFKIELEVDAQASNEYVKVKSNTLTYQDYQSVIQKIIHADYWDNPDLISLIYTMVPNYHLSKFQPYLPEDLGL